MCLALRPGCSPLLLAHALLVCRDQQYGWPPDPMWTESNWPGTPALTLYLKEASGTEWALLGAGLAVTAASLAVALGVQYAHQRKLKRQ